MEKFGERCEVRKMDRERVVREVGGIGEGTRVYSQGPKISEKL